jgi:hypothetical protein
MKGGMTTTNPMLAFGEGPEGRTCNECYSYDLFDGICSKRSGRVSRSQAKPHDGKWPACRYFLREWPEERKK